MFFSLAFGLIWMPLTIVFIVAFFNRGNKTYLYLLLILWAIPFILWAIVRIMYPPKMNVTRSNIYGTYVIDRSRYAGKQADWQYDHFKFKIEQPDKFTFYVMEEDTLVAFYRAKVIFSERFPRRIALEMIDTPAHHIIAENPTLYREPYSFYYVFNSKKLGNVFFTKKKWWEFSK
jgi:hypothetical protein